MCGILFIRYHSPSVQHLFTFDMLGLYMPEGSSNTPSLFKHIFQHNLFITDCHHKEKHEPILRRGPDRIFANQQDSSLFLQSILSIRGEPIDLTKGDLKMLFNGEIWSVDDQPISDLYDTDILYNMLKNSNPQDYRMVVQRLKGDYVIILQSENRIDVFKDSLGKKSLLLGLGKDMFCFSSCAIGNLPVSTFIVEKEKDPVAQKYHADYSSAINKVWYEIPANSHLTIILQTDHFTWYRNDLVPKKQNAKIVATDFHSIVFALLQKSVKMMGRGLQKLAVLFSGGVDSSLLVRILDMELDEKVQIYLITVSVNEKAADWVLSTLAFEQLQKLAKRPLKHIKRVFQLKEMREIENKLKKILYPRCSEMDCNIGSLLWAAASLCPPQIKVIFSGLGADQIFCGYSRYRVANQRGQTREQMKFDLSRIWIRNLGRDDRAVADQGKEMRYPFLEPDLIGFVQMIPIQHLANYTLPKGMGDKQLLRQIAKQIGLQVSSLARKKAIQFGTGLSKQSNIQRFGSNRKGKGHYEEKMFLFDQHY